MANNFINARLQVADAFSTTHNIAPTEIDRSQSQDPEKMGIEKNYFYNVETRQIDEITIKNYKQIRKKQENDFKKLNDEFKDLHYKRRKRHDCGDIGVIEGVFTFSEQLDSDLDKKYSKKQLFEKALLAQKEICEKWGTEPAGNIVLHMDETRAHFHFYMKNFDDTEDGYTLLRKKRFKKDLSEVQDIAAKHFGEIGMERGLKKELTFSKYKKQSEWHKEQNSKVKNETKTIQNFVELFETIILSDNLNELNEFKKEIENLKKDTKDKMTDDEIKISNLMMRTITSKIKNEKIEKSVSNFLLQRESLTAEWNKLFQQGSKKIDSFLIISKNDAKNVLKETISKLSVPATQLKENLKNKEKELQTKEIDLNEKLENVEKLKTDLTYEKTKIKQKETEMAETYEKAKKVDSFEKRKKIIESLTQMDPRGLFEFEKLSQQKTHSFNCSSPLRDDENASMAWHFENGKWKFKDFGTDFGGDIFDFFKEKENLSFNEVISKFETLSKIEITPAPEKTEETSMELKEFEKSKIYFNPLKDYLKDRKIENVPEWLKQYKFKSKMGNPYYTLGIVNDVGGVAIRNRQIKGNNGNSSFSHIKNGSKKLVICEGMFDGLHLNQYLENEFFSKFDLLILNSIENKKQFFEKELLKQYDEIFICLDNDKAGIESSHEIQMKAKELKKFSKVLKPKTKDFAEDFERGVCGLSRKDFEKDGTGNIDLNKTPTFTPTPLQQPQPTPTHTNEFDMPMPKHHKKK